jgi:hypothetical protein
LRRLRLITASGAGEQQRQGEDGEDRLRFHYGTSNQGQSRPK